MIGALLFFVAVLLVVVAAFCFADAHRMWSWSRRYSYPTTARRNERTEAAMVAAVGLLYSAGVAAVSYAFLTVVLP